MQNLPYNITDSLWKVLTEQESGEKFIIFGLEAGAGKSITTDQIIAEHISGGGKRRFLIVKKFVTAVNETVDRINGIVGSIIATGITGDNWAQHKSSLSLLPHIPVIVITQRRYLDLALDPEMRAYFEQNRQTLVIDECIELPTYTFSEFEPSKIIACLQDRYLRRDLDELCSPFLYELANPIPNAIKTCSLQVNPAQLRNFHERIKANWNVVLKPDEIMKHLDTLAILSQTVCYHNGNRIMGLDSRLKFWTLNNNIILDANAGIDKRYDCSPKMVVNVPMVKCPNWLLRAAVEPPAFKKCTANVDLNVCGLTLYLSSRPAAKP